MTVRVFQKPIVCGSAASNVGPEPGFPVEDAYRTAKLRRLIEADGLPMNQPLPDGSTLYADEGKCGAGERVGMKLIDLSGMVPGDIRSVQRRNHLDHILTDGSIETVPFLFQDHAGGRWSFFIRREA